MAEHEYRGGYRSLKVVEQQLASRLAVEVGDVLCLPHDHDLSLGHHRIAARMGEDSRHGRVFSVNHHLVEAFLCIAEDVRLNVSGNEVYEVRLFTVQEIHR